VFVFSACAPGIRAGQRAQPKPIFEMQNAADATAVLWTARGRRRNAARSRGANAAAGGRPIGRAAYGIDRHRAWRLRERREGARRRLHDAHTDSSKAGCDFWAASADIHPPVPENDRVCLLHNFSRCVFVCANVPAKPKGDRCFFVFKFCNGVLGHIRAVPPKGGAGKINEFYANK